MSDNTIIDGSKFTPKVITYLKPKVATTGAKSIKIINKDTKSFIKLATPLMLSWGVKDYEGNKKYALALQFPSEDYFNQETDDFLKNMVAFEEKIKTDAITYSKEWFGKQLTPELIDYSYNSMLKYPKIKINGQSTQDPDKTKAPTLQVKVNCWEGQWKCELYDEEGNKTFPDLENPSITPIELLPPKINIVSLIQCTGIWVISGRFGVTWSLVQAMGQTPKTTLSGQCLLTLKKTDKDKIKDLPVVEQVDYQTQVTQVIDSDDEGEDEEQQQQEKVLVTPVTVKEPEPEPIVVEETVKEVVKIKKGGIKLKPKA
jgi:hypothetical protein